MIVCFVSLRERCLKYAHVYACTSSHPVRAARTKDPLSLLHPKVSEGEGSKTHIKKTTEFSSKRNTRIITTKRFARIIMPSVVHVVYCGA